MSRSTEIALETIGVVSVAKQPQANRPGDAQLLFHKPAFSFARQHQLAGKTAAELAGPHLAVPRARRTLPAVSSRRALGQPAQPHADRQDAGGLSLAVRQRCDEGSDHTTSCRSETGPPSPPTGRRRSRTSRTEPPIRSWSSRWTINTPCIGPSRRTGRSIPRRRPTGWAVSLTAAVHAAFCDGSVHFLPKTIDPKTLKALFTRAGGEPVSSF